VSLAGRIRRRRRSSRAGRFGGIVVPGGRSRRRDFRAGRSLDLTVEDLRDGSISAGTSDGRGSEARDNHSERGGETHLDLCALRCVCVDGRRLSLSAPLRAVRNVC